MGCVHNNDNPFEKERVEKLGGWIRGRLGGNLAVSRALGDFDMKKYGLISEPDILELPWTDKGLLFLASDGIWDVVETQALNQFLNMTME